MTALTLGEVVAYPTEAVYGLGCDPLNASAVARLWQLKQRPPAMGMIVIAGSWQALQPFMSALSADDEQTLRQSWPAGMTWVVPARSGTPDWLTGGRDTIAVRWSAHADVIALCSAFGGALVSTSANVHGQPAAKSVPEVLSHFSGRAGFAGVVSGALGAEARPTPIRELTTGKWIRV